MARIENHKYSIEEAFRECFYIVPDYQREYVWTDKEVHQLLEDVGEQIDAGTTREYFIGTVLVSPTEQKNHYEVIDGQQRLTTFFLLLCALKHLFQGEPQRQMISGLISTSYVDGDGEVRTNLKLEPRYESAGEVMAKLVELDADPQTVRAGIQASGIASFGSLENLINAYSTLYRYLKDNYDDAPKLKKYWGYLANNVVFIQISTDVSSALKIFETINERGVGLNPMDLLKNLLFTQVKQAQFTQLKDEWKKITKPLEKEKEKPLRFLRYFLMANYVIKNERGDAVVREDEIYDWFIAKDNASLCDYANKPFEFVRKVIRNVEHYLAFANGLGNDGKPSLAMDSLKRLAGGAFSLHYVLLLAAANFPKQLFDHFVAQLESFLFYYIFTKTPTKDLERSFSLWADELRAIAAVSDPVKKKAQLNVFVADRFEKNMAGKSQELADALKRFIEEFCLALRRGLDEYKSINGDYIGEQLHWDISSRAYFHLLCFLDQFSEKYQWEPGSAREYVSRLFTEDEWKPFSEEYFRAKTPDDPQSTGPANGTLEEFCSAAYACAMSLMSNAAYVQKELPSVELPTDIRASVESLCTEWIGTKHDVVHELGELKESSDIEDRIRRIMSLLGEDMVKLQEQVRKLEALAQSEDRFKLAYLLVGDSGGNVLRSFVAAGESADRVLEKH